MTPNRLVKKVLEYGYDEVSVAFNHNGYRFYSDGAWNVNVFGIRSVEAEPNAWDDAICIAYQDETDTHLFAVNGTTDPGLTCLVSPVARTGCAILVPGQYSGCYKIDTHNAGKKTAHQALCQRLGTVRVYRDNNRDEEFDIDPKTIEKGFFGVNIHRASQWGPKDVVGPWSAGCQVINDPRDFADFMSICKKSSAVYGNKFTYTLFDESEYF